MSLEQDIKQPKFRTEQQKVIINLIYSYNWMNEKLKVFFEKEDITQQQFNILRILRGAAIPLSTSQIRQRMLDKMSDTSRIVDRLITKAFVKKMTCQGDKRMVDVTITAKGKKLLEKLDVFELTMDEVAGSLSEADAKMLNSLLDKMREEQQ
jgi:DNA-binding MarR family transcriptional regulator